MTAQFFEPHCSTFDPAVNAPLMSVPFSMHICCAVQPHVPSAPHRHLDEPFNDNKFSDNEQSIPHHWALSHPFVFCEKNGRNLRTLVLPTNTLGKRSVDRCLHLKHCGKTFSILPYPSVHEPLICDMLLSSAKSVMHAGNLIFRLRI